jgi:uncharacterized protein YyaL (SSP411 family)
MWTRFYDAKDGGFWQASDSDPHLILRVKEDYDGAEPSGNSVATLSLLRLAALTGEARYSEAAVKTLGFFHDRLERTSQALPRMLQAADFALQDPHRVVISGDPESPQAQALLRAVHSVYQPRKVVLGTATPVEPFARTLASERLPQVFICTGSECLPPTNDGVRVRELLR